MQEFSDKHMESAEQITRLIQKTLNGEHLSQEETRLLETWESISSDNKLLAQLADNPSSLKEKLLLWHNIEINREANKNRGLMMIAALENAHQTKPARLLSTRWLQYAAAILLILGIGAYLFNSQQHKPVPAETTAKQDISAPGTNRAMLTLANGKKIMLDSAANGLIAFEGGTNIKKDANGLLVYDKTNTSNEIQYNELIVPRGSQIASIILSDGSKVFLNSASSLKYPVAFNGNERKVEITGEAYFEVAKDVKKKFIVTTNGVQTEVLGTSFNVNAYADELNSKVTLIDGSIKISTKKGIIIIKPGQQTEIAGTGEIKLNNEINISQVIAWQKGLFVFNNTDLRSVLKQVSRWYNVEIEYRGTVEPRSFGGGLNRRSSLSAVIKMLESNGVPCKIQDSKLIIGK